VMPVPPPADAGLAKKAAGAISMADALIPTTIRVMSNDVISSSFHFLDG
jgi:hypothetical protein